MKTYTAAEAHRIDIERGGEGKIRDKHWQSGFLVFDPELLLWRDEDGKYDAWIMHHKNMAWLPVTPEPEKERTPFEIKWIRTQLLERENEKLKAENAELKTEKGQAIKWETDFEKLDYNKDYLFKAKATSQSADYVYGSPFIYNGKWVKVYFEDVSLRVPLYDFEAFAEIKDL
jgi:hypothetical protein